MADKGSSLTQLKRGLISSLVVVSLTVMVAGNLPPSEIESLLSEVVEPYVEAAGTNQSWAVFAPDPRTEIIEFEARVHLENDAVYRWSIPRGDRLAGSYSDYRWLKWVEKTTGAGSDLALQRATVAWICDRHSTEVPIVGIELVKRSRPIEAPGEHARLAAWEETVYHEADGCPSGKVKADA